MNDTQSSVAYVISAVEGFGNPEALRRYAEVAGPAIALFGGHFVVSNTAPVVVEGETHTAHLSMVEFRSMGDAKTWYGSPEYAEALAVTPAAFTGRLLLFVEGGRP